jgi:hypothetical protein
MAIRPTVYPSDRRAAARPFLGAVAMARGDVGRRTARPYRTAGSVLPWETTDEDRLMARRSGDCL